MSKIKDSIKYLPKEGTLSSENVYEDEVIFCINKFHEDPNKLKDVLLISQFNQLIKNYDYIITQLETNNSKEDILKKIHNTKNRFNNLIKQSEQKANLRMPLIDEFEHYKMSIVWRCGYPEQFDINKLLCLDFEGQKRYYYDETEFYHKVDESGNDCLFCDDRGTYSVYDNEGKFLKWNFNEKFIPKNK
jgi:hypothetical protein